MIKKSIALVLALAMVLSFAACGRGNTPASTEPTPKATPNSTAAPLETPSYEPAALIDAFRNPNPQAEIAAAGANDFAFRLSAALAKEVGDKNFVCSPFSVWMPFAALVNATDAQYQDALLAALGAPGVSGEDLNQAASRMLFDLMNMRDKERAEEYGGTYHNPLQIANAIFLSHEQTLREGFARSFYDYYRGNVFGVDFRTRDAVDAVNRWADENTEGLIPEIIQEFDPGTVAAIANAIYFSDRWDSEFDPEQTKQDVFHAPTGDSKAWFMQSKCDEQAYYEDAQMQATLLPFKTGGGMYILLPKDGDAAGLLSSMTSEYFNKMREDSVYATVNLLLPRFSIESDIKGLEETLFALGVPLFDPEAAPLTGGLIEENLPVWVSDVKHKAVIEVDEKGTTAAAVTVVAMYGRGFGPQPTEPFEMRCDKPFAFVLYRYTRDGGRQILFTGIVNQPS
ncbi:MAG: hypothetical protein FWE69_08235 [Clostridiales bacterium]|nr:hypothetical protein [Clostridiales bacterium]